MDLLEVLCLYTDITAHMANQDVTQWAFKQTVNVKCHSAHGDMSLFTFFPQKKELKAVMAGHLVRRIVFLFCYFVLCMINFNKSLHCSKSSLHYSKTSKSSLETWSLCRSLLLSPLLSGSHINMSVLCMLCTKTNVLTNIKNQLTPMELAVETGIEKI